MLVEKFWANVAVGMYVMDQERRTWVVADERDGWVLLADQRGKQCPIRRPDAGTPVTVLVPTLDEAVATLRAVFPNATIHRPEEAA